MQQDGQRRFDLSDERGETVITLLGDWDLTGAKQLDAAFADARGRGAPSVVVDLCEARFIDSTVLGLLIGLHKGLDLEGRRLVVLAGKHMRLFRTTNLDSVIEVRRNRHGLEPLSVMPADGVPTAELASLAERLTETAEDESKLPEP